ncbi:MAG: family 20 glycosylhydrolase [Bacteroidetes bacterium]|nr:family 20 glycosylhydrolase [Bacteroidota bacterium]MDA1121380.1 family 20 glycosylhydrolase [Bacteroidota bacterium]
MKKILDLLFFILIAFNSQSQNKLDEILPVRGLCMSAPSPEGLDQFIDFINDELVPRKLNTLVLRIGYNYEYKSHPELVSDRALSKKEIKRIVKTCKEGGIKIIPQVNLLGHQSGTARPGKLLEQYPQFNETPHIALGPDIQWPNEWGLYCYSYCPLHPEVHDVVFDIMDEIVEVFEADAFHAGMDEVFYLGDDKCPRCQGKDKAELFAGEVTAIRNHLAHNNKALWIWGDRLIDGKTTGIGLWEASYNNTHRAIDMIPKDVVINDWHYERPDPTAAYFALKGFKVITCPWRFPEVTVKQLQMMVDFKAGATEAVKDNYQGMLHTVWTSAENTIDEFYGRKDANNERRGGNWVEAFKAMFDEIEKLETTD